MKINTSSLSNAIAITLVYLLLFLSPVAQNELVRPLWFLFTGYVFLFIPGWLLLTLFKVTNDIGTLWEKVVMAIALSLTCNLFLIFDLGLFGMKINSSTTTMVNVAFIVLLAVGVKIRDGKTEHISLKIPW